MEGVTDAVCNRKKCVSSLPMTGQRTCRTGTVALDGRRGGLLHDACARVCEENDRDKICAGKQKLMLTAGT